MWLFGVRPTITNNADLLAGHVVAPVPPRRMHDLSLEISQPGDRLWPTRHIELAYSADKEVACDLVIGVELGILTGSRDFGLPLLRGVIPGRVLNSAVEANVGVQVVLLRGADEIR